MANQNSIKRALAICFWLAPALSMYIKNNYRIKWSTNNNKNRRHKIRFSVLNVVSCLHASVYFFLPFFLRICFSVIFSVNLFLHAWIKKSPRSKWQSTWGREWQRHPHVKEGLCQVQIIIESTDSTYTFFQLTCLTSCGQCECSDEFEGLAL